MEPYAHQSNNLRLVGPEGFPDCQTLEVTKTEVNGAEAFISFWLPTAEELEMLKQGQPVALIVYSNVHPMVWVAMGSKNEQQS